MTHTTPATGTHDRRSLNIYLTERVLVMRGGRRLVDRMRGRARQGPERDLIERVGDELERSERTLMSFLRQIGVAPPHVRLALVGLAERAGRLKPNGRVTTRSPLTDLEEFDALTLAIIAAGMTWSALDRADIARAELVRERAETCADLAASLEPLRRERARGALGAA
jgi:hypothetical protein